MFNSVSNFFKRTDPDWMRYQQIAERKSFFTPDLNELMQFERVKVFVYNECQKTQPKHSVIETGVYGGVGYTESSDFVLYKKLLGKETHPFALPITDDQKMGMSSLIGDPGQIMGELYSLTPKEVIHLDEYMLNTRLFERKRTDVIIPFTDEANSGSFKVYKTDAFMYIGRPEFWLDQLSHVEAKKLIAKSNRLFNVKENKNNEPLSAYYVFDYAIDAGKK